MDKSVEKSEREVTFMGRIVTKACAYMIRHLEKSRVKDVTIAMNVYKTTYREPFVELERL